MSDQLHKNAEINIIELSDIAPRPVRWLWPGRIPIGSITVIQGSPGIGKSTIATDLAARLSAGAPMPLRSECMVPGGVLLLAPEDDLGVVKTRLEEAGANLTRIGVYKAGSVVIPDDLDRIEREVVAREVRLIVIDQMDEVLAPGCSPQSPHGVRRALTGLASMAARCAAAVVVIRNEIKSKSGSALSRGQGAMAIAAAARSVLATVPHPHDPRLRALVTLKTNLGPQPLTAVYRVVVAGDVSVIDWIEEIELHAEDLLDRGSARQASAVGSAVRFLVAHLAVGPVATATIAEAAAQEGIAEPTLRRARRTLGIISHRGRGDDRAWYLALPEVAGTEPEPEVPDDHQDDHGQIQAPEDQLDDQLDAGSEPPCSPVPRICQPIQPEVPWRDADRRDQDDQDDRLDHLVAEAPVQAETENTRYSAMRGHM
jgi:hypothetical protein